MYMWLKRFLKERGASDDQVSDCYDVESLQKYGFGHGYLRNQEVMEKALELDIEELKKTRYAEQFEIVMQMEQGEAMLKVSPPEDVHIAVGRALQASYSMKIKCGGEEIPTGTTFEDNMILEGAHLTLRCDDSAPFYGVWSTRDGAKALPCRFPLELITLALAPSRNYVMAAASRDRVVGYAREITYRCLVEAGTWEPGEMASTGEPATVILHPAQARRNAFKTTAGHRGQAGGPGCGSVDPWFNLHQDRTQMRGHVAKVLPVLIHALMNDECETTDCRDKTIVLGNQRGCNPLGRGHDDCYVSICSCHAISYDELEALADRSCVPALTCEPKDKKTVRTITIL